MPVHREFKKEIVLICISSPSAQNVRPYEQNSWTQYYRKSHMERFLSSWLFVFCNIPSCSLTVGASRYMYLYRGMFDAEVVLV